MHNFTVFFEVINHIIVFKTLFILNFNMANNKILKKWLICIIHQIFTNFWSKIKSIKILLCRYIKPLIYINTYFTDLIILVQKKVKVWINKELLFYLIFSIIVLFDLFFLIQYLLQICTRRYSKKISIHICICGMIHEYIM